MTEQETPNVGGRIRQLREAQGLSLRALSENCNLSINAISRIERGENSPTVSSLHTLATALDVPITDFFEEETEQTTIYVQPENRLQYQRDQIIVESLGVGLQNQQIEPFLITIEPGAGDLNDPITHPGQEFVYCLQGKVEYHVAEEIYQLQPGDSLLFEASQQHCFKNNTAVRATILIIFQAAQGKHIARHRHLET
jgi:transcriptional regulator with XRE-family HTH domain